MAGRRRPEEGGTEVLTKRGTLERCDDVRLISLLGDLRWLDGRGRIGLADPLKDGVTGLPVDGLSD